MLSDTGGQLKRTGWKKFLACNGWVGIAMERLVFKMDGWVFALGGLVFAMNRWVFAMSWWVLQIHLEIILPTPHLSQQPRVIFSTLANPAFPGA